MKCAAEARTQCIQASATNHSPLKETPCTQVESQQQLTSSSTFDSQHQAQACSPSSRTSQPLPIYRLTPIDPNSLSEEDLSGIANAPTVVATAASIDQAQPNSATSATSQFSAAPSTCAQHCTSRSNHSTTPSESINQPDPRTAPHCRTPHSFPINQRPTLWCPPRPVVNLATTSDFNTPNLAQHPSSREQNPYITTCEVRGGTPKYC